VLSLPPAVKLWFCPQPVDMRLGFDGLQAASDLAEQAQLAGAGGVRARLLGQGEARGRARLDGIGLLAAKESGPVVLVALRIAARQSEGEGRWRCRRVGGWLAEAVQEVQQIVGVRPGGVETDDEVAGAVVPDDAFEALAEQRLADGRLREREFGGGGLEVVAGEGGVVAVARGVDADAVASRRWRSGSVVW
jgi:hypothetical protein